MSYDLNYASRPTEYFLQFLLCFSVLVLADLLFAPHAARWYFIHVCINAMVVYYTWPDVRFCIVEPQKCFAPEYHISTTMPWMIGSVGHLYHVIAFRNIRLEDHIHHILMVPIAGIAGFMFLNRPGFNLAVFCLTGLPGGIDYVLLTLVKTGYIAKVTEKRLNVYLHVWFRMPLIVLGTGLFYGEVMAGTLPPWCLIGGFLTIWNGIYYMHDTISKFYSKYPVAKKRKQLNSNEEVEV